MEGKDDRPCRGLGFNPQDVEGNLSWCRIQSIGCVLGLFDVTDVDWWLTTYLVMVWGLDPGDLEGNDDRPC